MIMIMKLMIPQKITTSVYLERELEPLFSEVDHFDAEGRLTLEECDSGKVEHVYLPDGLELERKEYVKGILTSRTVYEYDDEGGAVGLSLYDTHGFKMMDESWDWSHDGRVARIKRTRIWAGYPPEKSRAVNYYRKDGKLAYSADSGVFTRFEYDSEEHLIREIRMSKREDGSPESRVFEYSYEYDDAGNWTVRIINGVVKLNRKIEYYPMANDHSM